MIHRILLLEDEENLNKGISLTLKKAGYQVTSVFTIFEAEKYLEEEKFALIICDITLPDGSGLDFGKKVHRESDTYYLGFAVLFSVFMYMLVNYEMSVNQQQMLTLMANHPELEAEILSVWKKTQDPFWADDTRSNMLEDTARRIEEKYGYDLGQPTDETAWWIFWAAGMLTGALLTGVMGCVEWHKKKKPVGSGENLQELYESLERFRQGDFETLPDYQECSEEWMKLWETVRELGVYFAGLKERLREEENSTKALITDISHQLKTPLASLRMSYELVAGNQLTEAEKEEFQAQEEKEIEKLELLLNELVNLSRLENHI